MFIIASKTIATIIFFLMKKKKFTYKQLLFQCNQLHGKCKVAVKKYRRRGKYSHLNRDLLK